MDLIQFEKILSLREALKSSFKIQKLTLKTCSEENRKEYFRLSMAMRRLKSKQVITQVASPTKNKKIDKSIQALPAKKKNKKNNKNTPNKSSNVIEENSPLVLTKEKKIFKNLEFLMQWELAPVLADENCCHFIPSQVEDLHAFIIQNYVLSDDKNCEKIPLQVLAVQFLIYLVERENCNVRVTGLKENLVNTEVGREENKKKEQHC
jgi:hypothetical protein